MRKNRILVILLAILLLFVSSSCNILSNINFDDLADKSPIYLIQMKIILIMIDH